jgi:hypothetical protein
MSEGLPLRPATAADVGAIRSLTREAYSKWVSVIGREPKPMTADYAEAVEKHCIDLLYFDGKLAAVIEMIPDAHHLLIENVAVSHAPGSSRRRRAPGSFLVPVRQRRRPSASSPYRRDWCCRSPAGLNRAPRRRHPFPPLRWRRAGRSCPACQWTDHEHVEPASHSILEHLVERWALIPTLGAADASVLVGLDDLPATVCGDPGECHALVLGGLAVRRTDP